MKSRPRWVIQNSGYSHHGASRSKPSFLRWDAASKSPYEDISQNLSLLRSRCRDLYAGSPLGRGAVERVVLNAVGSGLKLNVRIDPAMLGMSDAEGLAWAEKVEGEFDYWASSKDADYCRMMDFYELQVQALRSVLIDGECLAVFPYSRGNGEYRTSVQLIDADRLNTPLSRPAGKMIDEGVELDAEGLPCAYWIANRHPESEMMNRPRLEYKRIRLFEYVTGNRQILHLFPSERIGQHRGVPFLAPVIEQLKQLTRYTDAELMAAVISGIFAIFYQHEPREEGSFGEEEFASEQGQETPESPYSSVTAEALYGSVMDLPEGVKPVSLSPNRPNVNFDAFVTALVRQIGGALGIPSELMFLNFTSSYSASRGALLEAWKLFRYWRKWFASNFCQPVYEEWLREAVMLGRIDAPKYWESGMMQKAYAWAEWVGPSQGQLNPVQEANAAIMKVNSNLSTYQREAGEMTGEDWDLLVKQRQREEAMLKAAGLEEKDSVQDKK